MGDELLKAVADRLRDNVRKPDLVARLGGDEFVVLQITPRPSQAAAELASRIIASLSDAIRFERPYPGDRRERRDSRVARWPGR